VITYRLAGPEDATTLAPLLEAYMAETYDGSWRGTPERLSQATGQFLDIALAIRGQRVIGFVAWTTTYDLHHCYQGAEVVDMFVVPEERGHAVAIGLLATAAAHASAAGAKFLSGAAVPAGSGPRLYQRAAVRHGDRFHLSGCAFRALAAAHTTSARSLAKAVPPREWNFEG